MALLKLKALCAVAMSVALAGGGFGLYAIQADDKKPAQQGEKPKPQPAKPGEKPAAKPDGEKPKPANPDGEKPVKPDGEKKPEGAQFAGKVGSVDAKANTITLVFKGDAQKVIALAAGVKVFIDNKEGKLADVPEGSFASLVYTGSKGAPTEVTEVRITGLTVPGIVKQVDATTIALEGEKNPRSAAISAATVVTVNGKPAKATDLKAGDKVVLVLSADEKTALTIASGVKPGGGEKPAKTPTFGGKVTAVDATAKTITVTTGKGDNTKETVVKLTADAKITVDGKDAKIGDVPKGLVATFALVPAKDGVPPEATAVVVNGPTIDGTVKQVDATSITLTNVKAGDREFKLLPATRVTIDGKDAKATDLKTGAKVSVTLMADESGAVLIVSGDKPKPAGDKPKPEKEEGE